MRQSTATAFYLPCMAVIYTNVGATLDIIFALSLYFCPCINTAADVRTIPKPKNHLTMSDKEILTKLENIERNSLLAAKNVLSIDDVVLLTGLSKSYLYRLTSTKQIPYYKPNGKLAYFDRQEIERWMLQNRVDCKQDAEHKAAKYNFLKAKK